MGNYYADSSVLVKRHVNEIGTNWFRILCCPAAGNAIITSRISMVEVYSAFNRRLRESALKANDYVEIANDFKAICLNDYELIELNPPIVERSKLLLESHHLRGYDAVQLATALIVNETLQQAGLMLLTFLAADERLLSAAQKENLSTDNPNLYL